MAKTAMKVKQQRKQQSSPQENTAVAESADVRMLI